MEERNIAIQIEGLKKRYRLGTIGGGTLRGDIESWWARKRGKEDPNAVIGSKAYARNEVFYALDGIDLTIYKGERIGIIGHNGAGKSTLLKLISRVTAPTEGRIRLDGRVASMLEVGMGFNAELTGRENVYLNGAILGMTKSEVDSKIEQIIEFSEVRKFIDTPVKRYSSGMYVKLAFAVAAHLDAEIMIMDEVLAVGDMAFQKKCLDKMNDVSRNEGRTILYVSHNMNTIRQLCEECIVLDHGKVIFDGDVEKAISIYFGNKRNTAETDLHIDYVEGYQRKSVEQGKLFDCFQIEGRDSVKFDCDETIMFSLSLSPQRDWKGINFRFELWDSEKVFATALSDKEIDLFGNKHYKIDFQFDTKHIAPGVYRVNMVAYQFDSNGNELLIDGVYPGFRFEIDSRVTDNNKLVWLSRSWGNIHLQDVSITEVKIIDGESYER